MLTTTRTALRLAVSCLVVLVVLVVLVSVTLPAVAGAQTAGQDDPSPLQSPTGVATTSEPTTTLATLPEALGRSVVPPNSGQAPEEPGDRGGWQQLTVLGLIIGGIGLIGGLAARDIRRKRVRPS